MTGSTNWPEAPRTESCVLCSGGLDSIVLLEWAAQHAPAQPVYVRAGLAWEAQELDAVRRIVHPSNDIRPLAILDFDVRDLYPPSHWALGGTPPAYDTPDEDVYLPGRNLLLLSKTGVLAAARRIGRILIGPLAGNPFPDATGAFFRAMSEALSLGLAHSLTIEAPFTTLHKADVIRLGAMLGVPLGATLSCMNPRDGLHCGLCSKCRERRDAFQEADIPDPTTYLAPSPRASAPHPIPEK
jgi:7-cyano-7-deazaguanine synthase